MSRSGWSEDGWDEEPFPNACWLYTRAVENAKRGRRGQKLLIDLVAALDAMPEKKLVWGSLRNEQGVCALGAVAQYRGVDISDIKVCDDDDSSTLNVADRLNVAEGLAREVVYVNDDELMDATPEVRWQKVRAYAEKQIRSVP